MRKYILNFSVLSSLFGAIGLTRATVSGPRNYRLVLLWVAWAVNVAIAVAAVHEAAKENELEEW
jgi:hypothetical protein